MKINILNDIHLDIPFFLPEELEWLSKHFIIIDNTLVNQSTDVDNQATTWLTHILAAGSIGDVGWQEYEGYVDIAENIMKDKSDEYLLSELKFVIDNVPFRDTVEALEELRKRYIKLLEDSK